HLLGQARFDTTQAILHVHHRRVDVGARLEGDGDGGRTIGAAGRRHVEEPLHAVELLLHHLGDIGCEHRCIGTRIDRVHRQRRRHDRGILLDRQHPQREDAAQQDRECNHPREDRTVDEEAWGHWATRTTIPGWIFCWPSSTTRSPALNPSRITHWSPCIGPRRTGRTASVSPSPTTNTVVELAPMLTARCGTVMPLLSVPAARRTRTNCPGSRVRSGLRNSARLAVVPVTRSMLRSRKLSRPSCSYSVPSSSTRRAVIRSPSARSRLPDATARRSASISELDCEKFTKIGSDCSMVVSSVAAAALTNAPSVTSARLARPEIGAVTRA